MAPPQLEEIGEGLFATAPVPLPFADDLVARAFLLERPGGNVVIYNAPGLTDAVEEIRGHGEVLTQLISHEHEAMFGPQAIGAAVLVHEHDRAATARRMPVARTLTGAERLGEDLEAIPTPGHTPGATAFLWDGGAHRYLFCGDTLWLEAGRWAAVLLDPGARATYVESLRTLRDVAFDVLVPWGAASGSDVLVAVTPDEARDQIEAAIARLEGGQAS